ncbi:N-acylglucosamine 2-epimerase [Vibrio parahaemolyticus]|uniref:N-acylglucosamine 2-epimerase n=1 Tax=Vibrio parahaemolyticus TaxID=670 RepID=UPI0015DE119E|nr:N-acylglucosamine 2-epimerase [Vibrio parahaemolyticus]
MSFKYLTLLLATTSMNSFADVDLPSGDDWLNHVTNGLAPYWVMESAHGQPVGNFPTFRCDNGVILDPQKPCEELNKGWIRPHFDREYTRMKSRQTYAYGVLFHLTGDKQALELAKKGAYYLIDHLQDEKNGGFVSFTRSGKPGMEWQQRTSQDQAYALVGLAMYYYLTQDPKVEQALIDQQAFIFKQYRRSDDRGLAWVLKDGDGESEKQQELVAQLDQINGYLLLTAPLLPEAAQAKWKQDLQWLTQVMLDNYHSDKEQRFYGAIHHKAVMMPDAKHNDFGHTIKAYWMTYLTGQLLENSNWTEFGFKGMKHTLKQAQYQQNFEQVKALFSPEWQGKWTQESILAWQSRPHKHYSSSWEWAELDQAAMTVSLVDGSMKETLQYTLPTFMDVWVDHQYGGVGLNPKSTKAFHWGNGYHQFEHALVGYLYAQQMAKQPAKLYYARPAESKMPLNPYYFNADIKAFSSQSDGVTTATFTNIRP